MIEDFFANGENGKPPWECRWFSLRQPDIRVNLAKARRKGCTQQGVHHDPLGQLADNRPFGTLPSFSDMVASYELNSSHLCIMSDHDS